MIHDAWGSYSVQNIEEAEKFYSQILGVQTKRMDMGMLEIHPPGGTKILMYPKKDHQPAGFTVFNLIVDNIEKEADRLIGLGIRFERYPGFESDDKGIVRNERGPAIAWFKDPSGNILAIIEGPPKA